MQKMDYRTISTEPKAFLEAFRYMVANLEPWDWNKEIFDTVHNGLEFFQGDYQEISE